MLSNRDIICISSIDWDFIWQGHQEIMATFAAQGHRVLFVENTGVRSPQLRDLPRLKHRLLTWWKSTKGFRQVRDRLFVYAPVILPFPYSRIARWINRRLLVRALHRWMRALGIRRPIIWTFLPTPLVLDVITQIDHELVVYYCIDDLASSSPQARPIRKSEHQLFRQADLVFVTSEKLRERAAQFTDRVWCFPFGVDLEEFEQARSAPDGVPEDLRRLPGPVVGYVGGLHQWIDQELLASVAERLPQVSFALVGPVQTDVSRLQRCPNVHLLGARSHEEVPRYLKGCAVGIVPYRLSDYTAHVYPTKLNEYLAMGLPVVATRLPEMQRFAAEHGEVVLLAGDQDEFARAIEQAIAQRGPQAEARRIAVARTNSWEARIGRMSELMERQLAARQAAGERWQVALRRLYRAATRRALGLTVGLAAAYLVLFHSPVLWWIAEPLRVAQPPRQADAIVVFAGGVGESGEAGGGYQERVKHAVDLYQAGWAPRMIFSSGYTFVFQEAAVMKDLAMSLGVPASAILLETRARNTYDNVVFSSRELREHQWRTALLVSSPYHMRRALLTWRRVAPEIAVVPTPVPESQFYIHSGGASWTQIRGILHEYASLLYYAVYRR